MPGLVVAGRKGLFDAFGVGNRLLEHVLETHLVDGRGAGLLFGLLFDRTQVSFEQVASCHFLLVVPERRVAPALAGFCFECVLPLSLA